MGALFKGINVACISEVRVVPFRRIGKHPLYWKLFRKKHPILSLLRGPGQFDGILNYASIEIYGSNGRWLKTVNCANNAQASKLRDEWVVWVRNS